MQCKKCLNLPESLSLQLNGCSSLRLSIPLCTGHILNIQCTKLGFIRAEVGIALFFSGITGMTPVSYRRGNLRKNNGPFLCQQPLFIAQGKELLHDENLITSFYFLHTFYNYNYLCIHLFFVVVFFSKF